MSGHPQDGVPPVDADATKPQPESDRPSRSIGPYRLLQLVGEGGMGEVWLAEQTHPVRRRVALKVIKAGMDTAQVVARFEAERQALALMDHPAIATVYDGGSTPEGRPYFAMEHVKGEPITTYCDRQRLTTQARLELFMQVCEGVQHAHQKGVIHRDLKPSNVLVTLQGDHPVPKIIDFGVAKATAQHLTGRTLYTELGVMIGTPEYMSPEQAEMGGLDIDTRTDVYALGVILYELLTGDLPFDGRELRLAGFAEIQRTIREKEPPKPSTRITQLGRASTDAATKRHTEPHRLASELRGDLDWVTMRALEKDRTRRYQTANALAADLRRHLSHEPVSAGPPSTVYRAKKFVRRHRFGVGAAGAALTLLVLGAAGTGVGLVRATRAERAATAEAAKAKAINQFLLDTLGAANPVEGTGRSVTVLDALRGAEAKLSSSFAGHPEIEAAVRGSMGITFERLGFYADAERLLRSSLQIGDESAALDARGRIPVQTALAVALHDQGKLAEAEALYREMLVAAKGTTTDESYVSIKSDLALLLADKGDYAAAEPLAREVLAADRAALRADDPNLALSLNNLARVLRALGRHGEALSLHVEAEGLLARRRHPWEAVVLGNIGELECETGKGALGLAHLREALTIGNERLGGQHTDVLVVRRKLGNCLGRMGRYDEAETELLATLAAFRESPDAGVERTTQTIEELVRLYQSWGKREKAAEWRAKLPKPAAPAPVK